MSNIIKKLANLNAYVNANPFSILYSKFWNLETDMSDFFAFRLDEYETVFIAENNLSLLLGRHVECTHEFNFFDASGVSCGVYRVISDEFHHRLNINIKMTNGAKIGGFVHHVSYSKKILDQNKDLLSDVSFQHRGYTGFRKTKEFGYSYVHGNFGAMYFNKRRQIKSLAKLRAKHVYTPQFTIKKDYKYDLIFSNPFSKKTCIKFILTEGNSKKILEEVCINSGATYKLTLREANINGDCNISWETSLPVGRCVVFEYNEKYFDVFHS